MTYFISGTIDTTNIGTLPLIRYNTRIFRMFSCYEEFIQTYKPSPKAIFKTINLTKSEYEIYMMENHPALYIKYKDSFDNMMIYDLSNSSFFNSVRDIIETLYTNYIEMMKEENSTYRSKMLKLFKSITPKTKKKKDLSVFEEETKKQDDFINSEMKKFEIKERSTGISKLMKHKEKFLENLGKSSFEAINDCIRQEFDDTENVEKIKKIFIFTNDDKFIDIFKDKSFVNIYQITRDSSSSEVSYICKVAEQNTEHTIVIANSNASCAGLNLNFLTHIFIAIKGLKQNVTNQIVGRGLRNERDYPLRVFTIC